jgi:hypothetical protein
MVENQRATHETDEHRNLNQRLDDSSKKLDWSLCRELNAAHQALCDDGAGLSVFPAAVRAWGTAQSCEPHPWQLVCRCAQAEAI